MIDEATKNKLLQELEKSGNVYLSCLKVGVNKATYYRWLKEDSAFSKKAYQAIRFGRENNCDVAEHSIMLLVKEKNLKASEYILSHNSPRYKPAISSSKVFLEHKRATVEKDNTKPKNWEEAVEKIMPSYKVKALENLSQSDKEIIEKANDAITNGKNYKVGMEDIITYEEKKYQEELEHIKEIKERYEELGGIPPKPDGSQITDEELIKFGDYIEEWYIKRGKVLKMENDTIDFVDFSGRKQNCFEYLKNGEYYDTPEDNIDSPITDIEDSKSETEMQRVAPPENQNSLDRSCSDPATQNSPQGNNT
jgi:hypothetical protein